MLHASECFPVIQTLPSWLADNIESQKKAGVAGRMFERIFTHGIIVDVIDASTRLHLIIWAQLRYNDIGNNCKWVWIGAEVMFRPR